MRGPLFNIRNVQVYEFSKPLLRWQQRAARSQYNIARKVMSELLKVLGLCAIVPSTLLWVDYNYSPTPPHFGLVTALIVGAITLCAWSAYLHLAAKRIEKFQNRIIDGDERNSFVTSNDASYSLIVDKTTDYPRYPVGTIRRFAQLSPVIVADHVIRESRGSFGNNPTDPKELALRRDSYDSLITVARSTFGNQLSINEFEAEVEKTHKRNLEAAKRDNAEDARLLADM